MQRGALISRLTALGLLATPLLVALGAFAVWSIGHWTEAGRRIVEAEDRLHAAEARLAQVDGYGLLGEAWRDYAASDASGLVLEPGEDAARAALAARIAEAFDAAGGDALGVAHLSTREEPGLAELRLEAGGRVPAASLPGFLDSLEATSPFLHVDLLDLRARPDASPGAPLSVRLRVSAFQLRPEEAAR